MIKKILNKFLPEHISQIQWCDSWQEAAEESLGYQNNQLIETVAAKTKIFRDSLGPSKIILDNKQTIQDALALSYPDAGLMDVIDVGGACGAKYFELKRILPRKINRWIVLETLKMTKAGEANFREAKLSFLPIDNLKSAFEDSRQKKFLFASSVIQYAKDPLAFLDQIIGLKPDYFYLTRTPVCENSDNAIYVTVQISKLSENGAGPLPKNVKDGNMSYPRTLVPHDLIKEKIQRHYDIKFYFRESRPEKVIVKKNENKKIITIRDIGLLCAYRSTNP